MKIIHLQGKMDRKGVKNVKNLWQNPFKMSILVTKFHGLCQQREVCYDWA